MSLKQELETWVEAVARYDNNEYEEAIRQFDKIADTSKILFNLGVIHATLGEHPEAIESFRRSLKQDPYLAIAYFQSGVSNFLMGNFEDALRNFNDALLWLRGNPFIDYEQLQLKYKLYTAEILFNRGLCYIFLRKPDLGMHDLLAAQQEKITEQHEVIDEAIRDRAEGYTVFSIPVGTIYRPPEVKVKNLGAKDYLGKARLIATSDRNNTHTAFSGVENLKSRDPKVAHQMHSCATHSQHRSRQQSEPPVMHLAAATETGEANRPSTKLTPQAKKELIASLRLDNLTPVRAKPPSSTVVQPSKPLLAKGERPRPKALDLLSSRSTNRTRQQSEPRTPKEFASIHVSARLDNSSKDKMNSDRKVNHPSSRPQHHSSRPSQDLSRSNQRAEAARQDSGDQPARRPDPRSPERKASQRTNTALKSGGTLSNGLSPKAASSAGQRAGGLRGEDSTAANNAILLAPVALRIIRVKLRLPEDSRYAMIAPDTSFDKLREHVRDKLHLKPGFKMLVAEDDESVAQGKQEGTILLADTEDLSGYIASVREAALKDQTDTGKAEIWIKPAG